LQIVQTETPIGFCNQLQSAEGLLKGSMGCAPALRSPSHKRPLSTGQQPLVEVDDGGGSCPEADPRGGTADGLSWVASGPSPEVAQIARMRRKPTFAEAI
jgi:hypothetical protein